MGVHKSEQKKRLKVKNVSWVPQTSADLGCGFINKRYYAMRRSHRSPGFWHSYDIKKKRDCLIRQRAPKQSYDETDDDDDEDDEDDEDEERDDFEEPDPCKINDVLKDRYVLLAKKSTTSLSTVWLAHDNQKKYDVVVKLSSLYSLRVSQREIDILEKLRTLEVDTKFLVSMTDHFNEVLPRGTGHLGMVMDQMQQDLCMFLTKFKELKKFMPLLTVKQIARQMLTGLNILHQCGIIHADIKPENVLVTQCSLKDVRLCPERRVQCDEIHVKLADFGTSKFTKVFTEAQAHSLSYSCPEAILGLTLEPAADVWSTASVIFELVTGKELFINDNSQFYHLVHIIEMFGPMPLNVLKLANFTRKTEFYDENGNLRVNDITECSLEQRLVMHRIAPTIAKHCAEFLLPMLALDPRKRATAATALQHPWLMKKKVSKKIMPRNYRMMIKLMTRK